MKRFISSFAICIIALSVAGGASAEPTETGRLGVQKNVMAVSRMPSIPVATIGVTKSVSKVKDTPVEKPDVKPDDKPDVKPDVKPDDKPDVKPDDKPDVKPNPRDKEREACIRNNIGIGNTFVWASRYSDTSNYATMVEDVENPENNICFVRVELKSSDPKIDLKDILGKYFEMGRTITCGSWVDRDLIKKRILHAKKNARTWATVGGAVGGAAVGVGSMELFGNKWIGGSVQGQKALEGNELYRSQLLVMKKDNPSEFNEIIGYLEKLKKDCDEWKGDDKPEGCTKTDYDYLLSTK